MKNGPVFILKEEGFSLIELLITISIIAIAFLPLMQMYSVVVEQVYLQSDLTTARFLCQEEMERVKGSGLNQAQLQKTGDVWLPLLKEPPLVINGKKWRVFREVVPGTDPLEVWVKAYQWNDAQTLARTRPVAEVVSLIGDLDW